MNLKKIKEQVAKEFGITVELPTKWDYAMKLHYRTKTQLRMYDRVIEILIDNF